MTGRASEKTARKGRKTAKTEKRRLNW